MVEGKKKRAIAANFFQVARYGFADHSWEALD